MMKQITILLALSLLHVCIEAGFRHRCSLKPDPGLCRASIKRWFWDKSTQRCTSFIWGGCGGVVPYETLLECKRANCANECRVKPSDLLPPPGKVTCDAHFTSWYFNRKTGKCEKFSYSGCSPLGPFASFKECRARKCECSLRLRDTIPPPGTITCKALIRSWFYNRKKGNCFRFTYGGCSPIGFLSKKACLRKCHM